MNASGNLLLRHLEASDRAILAPFAEEVIVPTHTVLTRADAVLDAIYFPGAMTVSLEEPAADGGLIEVAVIGAEGMLGWPALLGCRLSPYSATVSARGGPMLRFAFEPLQSACRRSQSLHQRLLQFVHVIMVQMTCAIASHLQHSLNRRVARWILMRHDRAGGDVLLCQHDHIARCLSVRRASITDQLHLIEGERLIRCSRGRIVVRDREGLEVYAGSAYGQAELHYRKLIAPFGKTAFDG